MFGCASIVECERSSVGNQRDPLYQVTVRVDRSTYVTTPVKVEHDPIAARARQPRDRPTLGAS